METHGRRVKSMTQHSMNDEIRFDACITGKKVLHELIGRQIYYYSNDGKHRFVTLHHLAYDDTDFLFYNRDESIGISFNKLYQCLIYTSHERAVFRKKYEDMREDYLFHMKNDEICKRDSLEAENESIKLAILESREKRKRKNA